MKKINVIKASGKVEPFSEEKLIKSLKKSGADNVLSRWVTEKIKEKIRGTVPSSFIYEEAFNLLNSKQSVSAVRYRLKEAIMELGPAGYTFEKFIALVFQTLGYKTKNNIILKGECVNHEIDVFLEKNGKEEFVETKYHNQKGIKSDLKVVMYTYSRFLDLKAKDSFLEAVWLVTNTKLTSDAIKYACCRGIKVIAWNYPHRYSLQKIIERHKIYPITILTSLSKDLKSKLLSKGIVSIKEINEEKLNMLPLKSEAREKIKAEIKALLSVNFKI
jgi:hypothetical protein